MARVGGIVRVEGFKGIWGKYDVMEWYYSNPFLKLANTSTI